MVDPGQAQNFYLALLQVQIAVLGLVVAGIVTLMQILQNAKPRRNIRLLIRNRVLFSYVGLLTLLTLILCAATWAVSFLNNRISHIFLHASVAGLLLLLCIVGLMGFVWLVYRARHLLEADEYLADYLKTVSTTDVRSYLFATYAVRPSESPTVSAPKAPHRVPAAEALKLLKIWDRRYKQVKNVPDPFQPIRDYLKDVTFKYDELSMTEALNFYEQLFAKTVASLKADAQPDEYFYLARYLADSCLEFFSIFRKTSSEKHKESIIRLLSEQGHTFITAQSNEGLLVIVRALEALAKTAEEDEIILCVVAIHQLVDTYMAQHKSAAWDSVADTFEEACLSVTRLAESYYLQPENPLRTVPIVSHYTGAYNNVTAELVSFFVAYQDLVDRHKDTHPLRYFEALEAVIESLFARYAEIVEAGLVSRGLNVAYQHLGRYLFTIYKKFGTDAIMHNKPALLALCLSNLRRIIKPVRQNCLTDERAEITAIIIELALKGMTVFDDIEVKADGRTISSYTLETLKKHANQKLINATLEALSEDRMVNYESPSVSSFIGQLKQIA